MPFLLHGLELRGLPRGLPGSPQPFLLPGQLSQGRFPWNWAANPLATSLGNYLMRGTQDFQGAVPGPSQQQLVSGQPQAGARTPNVVPPLLNALFGGSGYYG